MKRGMTRAMNVQERTDHFWAQVDRSGDGCWPWLGSTNGAGRGTLKWTRGRTEIAARISWELAHGEIEPGLFACHRCDNGLCVRPSHLFLGTHRDNMDDMLRKGRGIDPPHQKGEQHPRAVGTDALVRQVREAFADGMSVSSLAREFGVSRTTLQGWVDGKVRVEAGGPMRGAAA